jgi:hypothetical protein
MSMDPVKQHLESETRRHFFRRTALGLGVPALNALLSREGTAAPVPSATGPAVTGGLPDLPHFAPKAKRAIYLFMSGAPCQMDLLDYKPKMREWFDKDLPESIRQGQRLTTMTSGQQRFPIAPSRFYFAQHGDGGAWFSQLLPHTASMANDIAVIRSMHTEAINHDPAITYICTGDQLPGKPSLGAWLSYGLGSLNENLPGFVVMTSTWSSHRDAQALYNRLWGSGFLASKHQGVRLRSKGDPVLFLSNPPGVDAKTRRRTLDALVRLNQKRFEALGDPETRARIAQYEMAFRMQSSVPELTDLTGESKRVKAMYGPDVDTPGTFAQHCLLARRMSERGVRFVQIFHRGWDQHGSVPRDLPLQARDVDQPATALVQDLKQRGMLEDTLVVWGGEFGRTIYCQGKLTHETYGRDHHPRCFSIWMAGGGVRGGVVHGETDDFCYNIVRGGVHTRDLNATILHQLGVDHRRLSVRFQGLDQRLTGVEDEAQIVRQVLA